jgi:hypothetical protein
LSYARIAARIAMRLFIYGGRHDDDVIDTA